VAGLACRVKQFSTIAYLQFGVPTVEVVCYDAFAQQFESVYFGF